MNLDKIKTLLGFSKKMGKLCYGQTVICEVQRGRTKLVCIDEGAANNTKDKYISLCKNNNVQYILLPKDEIGYAIGKPNVKVVCIKDANMCKTIIENLE